MSAEFFSIFIILLLSIFLAAVFRRLHLPYVVALLVGGVLVGPYGFDVIALNDGIRLLGEIGLISIMFIAGMETKLSHFMAGKKHISVLAFLNAAIPFITGIAVAAYFGYSDVALLLVGTIFISSSITVVLPSLEAAGMMRRHVGQDIIATAIVVDIISFVFLSIILQTVSPVSSLPLPLFYLLALAVIIALRVMIPKLRKFLYVVRPQGQDVFNFEVRWVFALLLGIVVIFQVLGFHPILAAFFAGMMLSDNLQSEEFVEKIKTISYGFFIPIFFVVIGASVNILVLFEGSAVLALTGAIIAGSVLSKVVSGYAGARITGYSHYEAALVGFALTPSLSATLAVTFVAVQEGIFDDQIATAIIILSIATSFVGPFIIERLQGVVLRRETPPHEI